MPAPVPVPSLELFLGQGCTTLGFPSPSQLGSSSGEVWGAQTRPCHPPRQGQGALSPAWHGLSAPARGDIGLISPSVCEHRAWPLSPLLGSIRVMLLLRGLGVGSYTENPQCGAAPSASGSQGSQPREPLLEVTLFMGYLHSPGTGLCWWEGEGQ